MSKGTFLVVYGGGILLNVIGWLIGFVQWLGDR